MIAPARVAAYETLRAVESRRADLPHALARAREALADERDRALAGELAAGTLRWQAALDRVIDRFASRPDRLDVEVRLILRLTLYQLLHLERVPASAAVNDAVNLARRVHKRSAAPLVNAVARRASRERLKLPLPRRPARADDRDAALEYLSVTLSHPRWLVARWLDRYGFEAAEAWAIFDNQTPALTLRANTLRIDRRALADRLAALGVQTTPTTYGPDGLVVTRGNPLLTDLADQGLFVVQEEASQLVPLVAGAAPGERVFDACASPGGKTLALASAMQDRGLIVAADVRARRVALLARTVAASGARSVHVVQSDAALSPPLAGGFDLVLLDAPCSGLGTIRRDPDIKWRRTEAELPALRDAQIAMVARTAEVLRPGGRLVYATCSSEPEENEAVIAASRRLGFRAAEPAVLPPAAQPLVNEAGHLRTLPHRDRLEAFFAAVVVKPGGLR